MTTNAKIASIEREGGHAMFESAVSSSRTAGGRFAAGCSGNPAGRPTGARNRSTMMMQALGEALRLGEADDLVRQYVEATKAGDKVALRFCVGRLVPAPRGRMIALDLPPGHERSIRLCFARV